MNYINNATISADIIAYTSLHVADRQLIEEKVRGLLTFLHNKYKASGFYGRLVQGDFIECAMQSPVKTLRIALLIKTYIKSIELDTALKRGHGFKYFKEYGVRMGIAIAPMERINPVHGVLDGMAIYLSGRAIKKYSTSDKQKIVIKNSMFFKSPDKEMVEQFDAITSLLDVILARCSAKQCEVIYYKLLGYSEKEISELLNRYQSTISQHSTAGGWNSIEKAVIYFENYITSCCSL